MLQAAPVFSTAIVKDGHQFPFLVPLTPQGAMRLWSALNDLIQSRMPFDVSDADEVWNRFERELP